MNGVRTFRMLAGGLTASLLIGAFGATAAEAKPTKPPGPSAITVTLTPVQPAVSGTTYNVTSSWAAVTGATKYRVALTKSGVTLGSATVTTPSWASTVTSTPGVATLSVTPVLNHRKGTTVSTAVTFLDVAAPQGTYTSAWTGTHATITQTSLADDSPVSGVTRVVSWGDGTSPQSWSTGSTLTHTYPGVGRYVPTVTLTDAAANTGVVHVPAVVIGDTTAPTGTFAAAPGQAWAGFTAVTLSQSVLGDDYTPADLITRTIDWGDGSAPAAWTAGITTTHVYATAGTFAPKVTITDEAGNHRDVITPGLTVARDSAAPVLKLVLPGSLHSVKAWTTLRGKATDTPGTGVKEVSVRAVEKRGSSWYAYKATTKTWVKAATKAKAFAKARALSMTTSATHLWAGKLVGLRKGTLIYKTKATDNVGNVSAGLSHKATLTRP